jgi:hypothetical protein
VEHDEARWSKTRRRGEVEHDAAMAELAPSRTASARAGAGHPGQLVDTSAGQLDIRLYADGKTISVELPATTRSSCCFTRDSVLLRQASSRRRGHPFSPFLCSAREVVGGRDRWWARRRLQEVPPSRHI